MPVKLILASTSPRRRDLLAGLGVAFDTFAPDIDETPLPKEDPAAYVQRIARAKMAVGAHAHPDAVVLAADTTVAVGRHILGKPADAADADRMLRLLSGRRHRVHTAVALAQPGKTPAVKLVTAFVKFRPLTAADRARFVANPANWKPFAGGYALQTSMGGALVAGVYGSHTGVVGLPLVETLHLLRRAGYDV
jgi:septum formation protein